MSFTVRKIKTKILISKYKKYKKTLFSLPGLENYITG